MESSKRVLFTNSPQVNSIHKFASNYQSTTKYNIVSFFPVSLFLQFTRVANIYFLVIAILQSVPIVSPLNPFSAIAPLVFVLAISMTREGLEDYFRYKSDKEANSTPILIYRDGAFKSLTFKDVAIGDVLLIEKDSAFPCDLILLSSCTENGIAYIETSTLDGEKNLKPRQSLKPTIDLAPESDLNFEFRIECEDPNPKIYHFSGSIEIENQVYSLDKNNLLLGGAFLRNTPKVIATAIYTGKDTKLRQNLMSKTSKQSKIEGSVNKYIFFIMFLQFSMCVVTSIGSSSFISNEASKHNYLRGLDYSARTQGVISFFTYFLLLNTMLPISLIVSLELLKVSQGFFMANDIEMYSALRDRPCKVSTYSITEELGMIQHIFSDKTGTLTCNRMEFKFCSIGNKVYGDSRFLSNLDFTSKSLYSTREIIFTFDTKHIVNDLFSKANSNQKIRYKLAYGASEIKYQDEILGKFLRCMALCHECLVDYEGGMLKYIGQSPDEITLVDAARHIGLEYNSIKNGVISLLVKPFGVEIAEEKYERICMMEFDSDRKRNSVVLRDLADGKIILYTKGADNVIRARLHQGNSKEYMKKIDADLLDYSKRGLRTLLLAFKPIPLEEFKEWKARYDLANVSIDNREQKLNFLAEEIETGLFLLGCTAVEDALQDEVPATIRSILKAGIKLWMLTGDKLETAINIGKTCGLLENDMKVFTCSESNLESCNRRLNGIADRLKLHKATALVIEGHSLEIVLYDKKNKEQFIKYPAYSASPEASEQAANCRRLFISIASQCATLICCRVTPGQKREVVKLMKSESKCISLAIGDGANDVSMILEADVGIGIYGEEGMQAIQACDYGIGEFKFLWELLLVHGRYNYMRVSEMILYFFYKNIVFTMPQFLYAFYCGFSGKSVYDDWYITLYNMIFTALPLMTRAIFEKDVMIPKRKQLGSKQEIAIRTLVPVVYSLGRCNQIFTPLRFLLWFSTGISHSFLVFFIPIYAIHEGIIDSDGHNADFWVFSITSFTCVIFIVNLKLAMYTRIWNRIHLIAIIFLSIGLYLTFVISYDIYSPTPSRGSVLQIISTPYFYVIIITTTSLVFIFDCGLHILRRATQPTQSELLMDYSIDYNFTKHQKKQHSKLSRLSTPEFTINS